MLLFWCHVGLLPPPVAPSTVLGESLLGCVTEAAKPSEALQTHLEFYEQSPCEGGSWGLQDGCRSRELPHSFGNSLCCSGVPIRGAGESPQSRARLVGRILWAAGEVQQGWGVTGLMPREGKESWNFLVLVTWHKLHLG